MMYKIFYIALSTSLALASHAQILAKKRAEMAMAQSIAGNLEYSVRLEPGAPRIKAKLKEGHFERSEDDIPYRFDLSKGSPLVMESQGGWKMAYVAISKSMGGTGHWQSIHEIQLAPGEPHEVRVIAEETEDRERFEKLSVSGNFLIAKILRHRKKDPLCCPTKRVTVRYPLK